MKAYSVVRAFPRGYSFVACFLWFALLGCRSWTPNVASTDHEVYHRVFRLVAENRCLAVSESRVLIVLSDTQSQSAVALGYSRDELSYWRGVTSPVDDQSVVTDFEEKNELSGRIEEDLAGDGSIAVVDGSFVGDGLFGLRGLSTWHGFYERYPTANGILILSRVGLSTDGAQALVYFSHWCGSRSAHGDIVLFEKAGRRWRIVDRVNVWRS